MALTAAQIVNLSCQAAKCPGMLGQAGQLLNIILQELAQNYDLAICEGYYTFVFQPGLTSTTNTNIVAGGGPYPLPADYLRAQNNEVIWFNQGVPYPLISIDMSQFDATVQQAGLNAYPYWYTTDMSQSPPVMYVYPPPSGAFPVQVRYVRQMPDIPNAESSTTVPWFPNQQYLRTRLTGELMALTDDDRASIFLGDGPLGAQGILNRYLKMEGDKNTRAQSVQLDRRNFGASMKNLPNTKTIGW